IRFGHCTLIRHLRQAPRAELVSAQLEMPAMPIAPVEADLEPVAPDQRRQTVDARDPDPRQRNGLVEQLHAGLAAELAAVADRPLAGAERIHPEPDRERDREQEKPCAEHRRSVNTVAFAGKPGRDRAPVLAAGVLVTIAPRGLARRTGEPGGEAGFRASDADR